MASAADRLRLMNARDLSDAAKDRLRGRKVLRRPPRQLWPDSIEREYVRLLLRIDNAMIEQVKLTLEPALPRILELAAASRPTFDSIRLDEYDYATEIENLMSLVRSNFAGIYSDAAIAEFVRQIAVAVSAQNGKELGKVFRSVLGVDLFAAEPWLASEMQAFVKVNVDLIKTLPSRFFPAIEAKVMAAAQQGVSWRELKKDLKKTYNNTNYQAERIARDQIGKFNGQVNMLRQQQAGLGRFTWRTARDERVRDEHRVREGVVYKWSDFQIGERPGEPIQCRCYAEPVIDDLLDF